MSTPIDVLSVVQELNLGGSHGAAHNNGVTGDADSIGGTELNGVDLSHRGVPNPPSELNGDDFRYCPFLNFDLPDNPHQGLYI